VVDVPSSWDWRDHGCVTPVKNQNTCGDASVMSAVEAIESCACVITGTMVPLSTQQVVDCDKNSNGCDGGFLGPTQVFDYVKSNGGLDSAACYPDSNQQGPCRYKEDCCAATLSNYTLIKKGDEAALQIAVFQGPVTAEVDASTWEDYQGGIYSGPCSSTQLDHVVEVVGYGNHSGVAYWIIRNSWGTSWGDNGYMLLRRNHGNLCGIASAAALPQGCSKCT